MNKTIKYIVIPILIIASLIMASAQDNDEAYFDSLILKMNHMDDYDTSKMVLLNQIGYEHYSVDTVEKYSLQLLRVTDKIKKGRKDYFKIKALCYMYWCEFNRNNMNEALQYAYKALLIADSIGNKRLTATCYYNIGAIYTSLRDATKSDEYYHKALDINKQIKDSAAIGDVLRNIAYNNFIHEMFDEAEECYKQAIDIDKKRENINALSEDHLGLGSLAFQKCESVLEPQKQDIEKAKQEYLKAIELAEQNNYDYTLSIAYTELPMILFIEMEAGQLKGRRLNEALDSCKLFLEKGYDIANKNGNELYRNELDFGWATYLIHTKQLGEAHKMLTEMQNEFEKDTEKNRGNLAKTYNVLSALYKAKDDLKNALLCQKKADFYYQQSRKQDYAVSATQNMAQSKLDEQMRLHKAKEEQLEADRRIQKLIITATIIALLILLILITIIIRYNLKSRRLVAELDKKDTEMTSSLKYASLIQRAVMPSRRLMEQIFGDTIIIYRPLNIVSGDFFWAQEVGRYKIIAVADCTGHGVPGAFLSMLGMSILDYLAPSISQDSEISAGEILDKVRVLFKQSLHQHGETGENQDGIDMALVIIDTQTKTMHYAGAFRPILLARGKEIMKYDADRMPIGIHYKESDHFRDNIIQLLDGDIIYMYSDGITDQFGYDAKGEVHKFTAKRLKELLSRIDRLSLNEQENAIEETLNSWRLASDDPDELPYEQTDDAILIGIKI